MEGEVLARAVMDDTRKYEHDAWMARIAEAVRSLRAATVVRVEQAQRRTEAETGRPARSHRDAVPEEAEPWNRQSGRS